MNILIVKTIQPFFSDASEALTESFQEHLANLGHHTEVLRLPVRITPLQDFPAQLLMLRTLELSRVDHILALGFPASMIKHPHKSVCLFQTCPQLEDILQHAGNSNELTTLIENAAYEGFNESQVLFTDTTSVKEAVKLMTEILS